MLLCAPVEMTLIMCPSQLFLYAFRTVNATSQNTRTVSIRSRSPLDGRLSENELDALDAARCVRTPQWYGSAVCATTKYVFAQQRVTSSFDNTSMEFYTWGDEDEEVCQGEYPHTAYTQRNLSGLLRYNKELTDSSGGLA